MQRNHNIIFPENVGAEILPELNGASVIELMKEFRNCLNKDEIKRADLVAKKMAVDHGVPGLICFAEIRIKDFMALDEQGEKISRQAFNLLPYLFIAERMWVMSSPKQKKEIHEMLPEQGVNQKTFWKDIIDQVCDLGKVSQEKRAEAKLVGLRMLQDGSTDSDDRRVTRN